MTTSAQPLSNLFCRQIHLDCKFLESQLVIDYSLLLGLHFRAPEHLKALLEPPDAKHKSAAPVDDGNVSLLYVVNICLLRFTSRKIVCFSMLTKAIYVIHIVLFGFDTSTSLKISGS